MIWTYSMYRNSKIDQVIRRMHKTKYEFAKPIHFLIYFLHSLKLHYVANMIHNISCGGKLIIKSKICQDANLLKTIDSCGYKNNKKGITIIFFHKYRWCCHTDCIYTAFKLLWRGQALNYKGILWEGKIFTICETTIVFC